MSGSDGKKVLWGVVYDHVVEEPNENDEVGLRRFSLYIYLRRWGGGVKRSI